MDADKSISLTSDTKFLVHNMDGTYSAYTGYKNVPSLIAHYAEVSSTPTMLTSSLLRLSI